MEWMVDTRRVVSVQFQLLSISENSIYCTGNQSISQGVSGTTRHMDIDISIDTVGWMGGWVDGWTDGWMVGWMDGLVDRRTD